MKFSLLLFFCAAIVSDVSAQAVIVTPLTTQLNIITTAVPFLQISPDARSAGMGDAGVATYPDAYSLHWNT